MTLKRRKPNTGGMRNITYPDFTSLSRSSPRRALSVALKRHSGRDRSGQISVRHRGGGSRRKYRILATLDKFPELDGDVKTIEYDPNRSARIAQVSFENGTIMYILAPEGLKVGAKVKSTESTAEIKVGNRSRLRNLPTGIEVHNIELYPQGGVRMVRSAGTAAEIVAKEGEYAHIRLPSGEVRKIHLNAYASIGKVGNLEHSLVRLGKAGRVRHMGRRPTVRGKAMHPAAHPHGGGEGVNPIGLKRPKTPWGKPALGYRTRRGRSQTFIVKTRKG